MVKGIRFWVNIAWVAFVIFDLQSGLAGDEKYWDEEIGFQKGLVVLLSPKHVQSKNYFEGIVTEVSDSQETISVKVIKQNGKAVSNPNIYEMPSAYVFPLVRSYGRYFIGEKIYYSHEVNGDAKIGTIKSIFKNGLIITSSGVSFKMNTTKYIVSHEVKALNNLKKDDVFFLGGTKYKAEAIFENGSIWAEEVATLISKRLYVDDSRIVIPYK
jgi:hypothetical protein